MKIETQDSCSQECQLEPFFTEWANGCQRIEEQTQEYTDGRYQVVQEGKLVCEGVQKASNPWLASMATCRARCSAPRVEEVLFRSHGVKATIPLQITPPPKMSRYFTISPEPEALS